MVTLTLGEEATNAHLHNRSLSLRFKIQSDNRTHRQRDKALGAYSKRKAATWPTDPGTAPFSFGLLKLKAGGNFTISGNSQPIIP